MPRAVPLVLLLLACGLGAGSCERGAPRRPNVLLVSIDMLRADHLACYGYGRATSPAIDRLAAEGALFEQHVSSTSWTLPAHAALFTGLPGSVHGCTDTQYALDARFETLAERFEAAGYETAGFFSGPYLHPAFGLAQGFERYEDCTSYAARLDGAAPERWQDEGVLSASHEDVTNPTTLAAFERWFGARSERPFFAFVHLWDVHYDFLPPPPYDTAFDPDYRGAQTGRGFLSDPRVNPRMPRRDLEHLLALYDGEIAWTDLHVGKLRALLEAAGALDDTVVVVTADHGTEFFEHGDKGHRKSLYDEVLHVPLVVRYPARVAAGVRVARQTRMVDVAPTLIEVCGLAPDASLFGRSLLPLLAGRAAPFPELALSELDTADRAMRSVRTASWKLLQNREKEQSCALDLVRDPDERRLECDPAAPLLRAALEAARGLDARLAPVAAAHAGERARSDAPPAVERQLEDLGYTGGDAQPR